MDRLGDAIEGSNNPMTSAKTISADGSVGEGGGSDPVVGLSFVTAGDMDVAHTAAPARTAGDTPEAA